MPQSQYAELIAERDQLRAENAELHALIETQRERLASYGAAI